ncbi:MAG: type III secretion protein [Oscillospiraceae bacterium]|nr:type III secretion protein [Oscillospiraceae bacterium]
MSKSKKARDAMKSAVALQYGSDNAAPVVVASGMGYLAEKIVETAADNGVPIYEDNSLATILSQLELGQEIPGELYKAIVEIYVYFLHFDPTKKEEEAKEETDG